MFSWWLLMKFFLRVIVDHCGIPDCKFTMHHHYVSVGYIVKVYRKGVTINDQVKWGVARGCGYCSCVWLSRDAISCGGNAAPGSRFRAHNFCNAVYLFALYVIRASFVILFVLYIFFIYSNFYYLPLCLFCFLFFHYSCQVSSGERAILSSSQTKC